MLCVICNTTVEESEQLLMEAGDVYYAVHRRHFIAGEFKQAVAYGRYDRCENGDCESCNPSVGVA